MTVADLTPDALAELEAQLTRDLEMVRRVRALLLEHQTGAPAQAAAVTTPAAPPAPAPPSYLLPQSPQKPIEDVLLEGLHAMPDRGFRIEDLRQACKLESGRLLDSSYIKTFLKRMVRQGKVAVLDVQSGRRGSLYQSRLPRPDPAEMTPSPADTAAEPADS